MRRGGSPIHAVTLSEMLVAMGASVIILGGLIFGAMTMQRALTGSQRYAEAYSDQHRVIDFIARDLRRALHISLTDADGKPVSAASRRLLLQGNASLRLQLPGYYRQISPGHEGYDEGLEIRANDHRLDYGTSDALATPQTVVFRKLHLPQEGGICLVREEDGHVTMIMNDASRLSVEVEVAADAQSVGLHVWFPSLYSAIAPVVSTHDRVFLRNTPHNFRP